MRLSIQRIIAEAQDQMSAHSVYLFFKYANISVKAEAEALLSTTVSIEKGDVDIEETADVVIPSDDKFVIVPKKASYIFAICKGIATEHPEYKIERKVYQDDGNKENKDLDSLLSDDIDDANLEDLVICCTMPVMNQDRHDTAIELINTFYDEAITSVSSSYSEYQVKLAQQLVKVEPQEADEANNKLDEIFEQQKTECEKFKKDKTDQVEKAYQKYLNEQQNKEKAQEELAEAQGQKVAKSMSFEAMMNPEE